MLSKVYCTELQWRIMIKKLRHIRTKSFSLDVKEIKDILLNILKTWMLLSRSFSLLHYLIIQFCVQQAYSEYTTIHTGTAIIHFVAPNLLSKAPESSGIFLFAMIEHSRQINSTAVEQQRNEVLSYGYEAF